jgi:hypothetical protein
MACAPRIPSVVCAVLTTLHDAGQYILSLSERQKRYGEWISATELLMDAAKTEEVYKVTRQLEFALFKGQAYHPLGC